MPALLVVGGQEILQRARTEGRVDVVALAEDLRVTTETIRRDLRPPGS